MSYSQNVERQISRSRFNTNRQQNQNLESARIEGQAGIRQADQIANSLSQFSTTLQKQALIKKEENIAKGKQQAREDKQADAVKLAALHTEMAETKEQDTRFKEIQNEILAIGGEKAFPDAARIANLSPWTQVGYAQEKIRAFNETFPDKLAHSMANSEQPITVGGFNFTPKQLKDNNINEITFKRASVDVLSKQIKEAAGMDKFSPELLALTKTGDKVQSAKDDEMDKHRANYNISSSFNTRQKLYKEWQSSPKTGDDLYRLHLGYSATVDKNNNPLGNLGGWSETMSALTSEGIASGDPYYADKIGAQEIPPAMASRLGIKQGKTFVQHWPGRFKKLKRDILDGKKAVIDQKLEDRETQKNEITTKFYDAVEQATINNSTLSFRDIKFWKEQYRNIGVSIPEDLKNYETASQRIRSYDEIAIQNHIDLNDGITTQQLKSFHPLAAGKFRKKAEAYEQSIFDKSGGEDTIVGALDENFANMGVTDREKSMAYQTALHNAKQDFFKQYHQYVSFGLPSKLASHLAVHGVSGVDQKDLSEETKSYLKGRLGVAEEIEKMGEKSKYTRAGLHLEKTVGSDFKRARFAMTAGKEMLESKEPWKLRKTKILGGDYGQAQIDAIKKNIEKYGFYRGIAMSEEHTQFYKAIMSTRNLREGDWWGLLHDQLIVDDPKSGGLERFPPPVPSVLPLLNKKVKNKQGEEENVEDPDGTLEVSSSAIRAANKGAVLLAYNTITDADNYHNKKSNGSIFDQPDQLPAYLGGTA